MKGLFILFVKLNKSSLEKPHTESAVCFDQTSFWKWKQRYLLSTRVMIKLQGWVIFSCTYTQVISISVAFKEEFWELSCFRTSVPKALLVHKD